MDILSTTKIEEMMLNQGGWKKEKTWDGRAWYTNAGGGAVLEFAASHYAKTFPDLPSITMKQAKEMIAARGNRLDDNPPGPGDFTPGIKASLSLPPGELRLNSQRAQMAGTMLTVAAFGAVFDYRRAVMLDTYPELGKKLPCDVAVAVVPVVHEVYSAAIRMGRPTSYACFCSPAKMIEYARMGAGCTVIQLDDRYGCWIIPNGKAQVFARELGDPNGTGNLPMWIRLRIKPLEDVTVGWIKD